MITGIEIVSLAFAVPPLISEAIKTAPYVINPVTAAFNRKRHKDWVEEQYRDLNFEITIFKEILDSFVGSLPLDAAARKQLRNTAHLSHDAWTEASKDIWEIFKHRLNDKTSSFVHHVEAILKELEKFVADVPTSRSQSYPPPLTRGSILDLTSTSFLWLKAIRDNPSLISDRFFFGIKKERRKKGIERIAKYNERLRTLLRNGVVKTKIDPHPGLMTPDREPLDLSLRHKMAELPKAIAKFWCRCADAGHHILVGLFRPWTCNPVRLDFVMDLSKASDQRRWSESTLQINSSRTDNKSTITQFPKVGSDIMPDVSQESIQLNSHGSVASDIFSHSQ